MVHQNVAIYIIVGKLGVYQYSNINVALKKSKQEKEESL